MPLNIDNKVFEYSASTKICLETASTSSPYQTGSLHLAGYNIEELADNVMVN